MRDQNTQNKNLSSMRRDLLERILKGTKGQFEEDLIRPFKRPAVIPASFAQKRLWLLDQLYPQSASYNVPYVLRLKGQLHADALQNSLQELVNRHESLRTTFSYEDENILQIIADSLELNIAYVDLSHLAEGERTEECMRQMTIAAQIPFSLTNEPLMRAQIFHITSTDHYLLLNFHHIITDGWSENIFFKELDILYRRYTNKNTSIQLPELPLHYVDYTLWQYDWLKGEVFDTQLAYWKKQLQGELPVLALPYDRPRPASKTDKGARLTFSFTHTLFHALKLLSRQEEASLYMTLLTAFNILLYRYTRQKDILVATPIANRSRQEWEEVIGFFANTILFRTDLSGNPSFHDILRRVRTITLEAYNHQDIPFERLVEKLSPNRDLSTNPLFQVLFNLYAAPEDMQFPELVAEFIDIDNQTANFDLDVGFVEKAGKLHGRLTYNTDLFDETTIKRLIAHYQMVLAAMVQDPNQSIDSFELLTEEEHQLLTEWNATDTAYPEDLCLHHLFEQQVRQSPDELAVIFADQSLTYRELNQRANGLAKLLREHNVGPEICVGTCIPRSLEMVVAVLGILKAGGAYVPLDPHYPPERLQYIIDDAHITLILTKNQLREPNIGADLQYIHLDEIWDKLELIDENIYACLPDNLLYLTYTSGSTGKPKGVALAHRPLVNLITWQEKRWVYAKKARCLQFSSLSFDLSCFEIFTTFATGSALILPEDDVRDNPERLLQLLADQQVERACFPYVGLQQIAEVATQTNVSEMKLKEIIVTGEQLRMSPQIVSLLEQLDACVLHNYYGPSETHAVTTYPIFQGQERQVLPPIGRPLANTQIYILDSQLHPVPPGVQGELYIAGICLARGYSNNPGITGERFVPNPFSSAPGARMYKSGDLVRYLPDGNIQFFGRSDHQVKIRGFRVEPGEIEAALQLYPGITKAIVIARKYASGLTYLAAYYVANQEIPGSVLRAHLRNHLPDYMVPTFYMQMESMPLTPSGKIDRIAFPVPNGDIFDFSTWVEPATPIEQQIADIWSNVLGRAHIGRNDHFFHLGGHSLIATQVITRVRNTWQVEAPLRLVFEAPVLKDFASRIEQGLTPTIHHIIQKPHSLRNGPNPLSFAQERLWFFDRLKPGDPAYNLDFVVNIRGALNRAMLEWSLNRVIHRHEILRTSFQIVDHSPEQVIVPELSLPLNLVDLQDLPYSERMPHALQLAMRVVQQPFNLSLGPLLRASIYQITDQEFLLVVAMHHIISDGWSMNLFSHELFDLYESRRTATDPLLMELPIQYADFARWQREWLTGEVLQKQLSFWKQQLGGPLASTNLPLDYPRPPIQSYRGAQVNFTLSNLLTSKIHRFSEQENVSLYMALLTVFGVLLYRYTGQEDLRIGTPIANRNRQEIEGLIGVFVNTLVLRLRISQSMTWKDLLHQVKQVALDAYAHQDAPFEKVVEEIQPERDLSTSPLFQIMFHMQNTPRFHQRHEAFSITPLTLDCQSSVFDLSMLLEETDGMLLGTVEYSTDLFHKDTIHRLIDHYEMLLASLLANADQQLWQAPMLTDTERQQLLIDWNQTKQSYPDTGCVHHSFEQQVENTPDAIAISYNDQQLTYKALNERANQLAHRLRRSGVGPEVLVGLCLERSPEMVVGILGILKAGGAYIPLDPAYPSERLLFCLHDAHASLLLSQRSVLEHFPTLTTPVLCLEDVWPLLAQESEEACASEVTEQQLAYVIYTSGSTGQPKGVAIPHAAVSNLMQSMQREPGISSQDVVCSITSISFDIAVSELLLPLVVGARVLLLERHIAIDGSALAVQLKQGGATLLQGTPTTWRLLVNEHWQGQEGLKMFCGGEMLPLELISQLQGKGASLWNMYGPTETTVWSTMTQIKGVPERVSIGRGIDNTQLYILDACYQPVPIGVTGELYIAGAGLARGYLQRPALSAERFVPDPWSQEPGARMYRTGDLACWRADGNIECLGRNDQQVKLRGHRIELGEIEALLLQHPLVQEAAVTVREDAAGDKRLVAYLVGSQDLLPLTIQEWRAYLQTLLPDYMLPATYVKLESLPLTPNRKLDRRALPAPDTSTTASAIVVEPRDMIEMQLKLLWEDLLDTSNISVTDNFFSIGGHSLLAVRLIAQIERRFQKKLPLATLFQAGTIEQQARLLRRGNVHRTAQILLPLQPQGSKPPFFFVHPIGGHVLAYVELAKALGTDQPFYAFQAPGLEDGQRPLEQVEALAALYIDELQTRQKQGPYRLGGWSFGGLVAFEMAQQLKRQGDQVESLALLDTSLATEQKEEEEVDDLALFVYDLAQRYRKDMDTSLLDEYLQLEKEQERLGYILHLAKQMQLFPAKTSNEDIEHLVRVFRANRAAYRAYQPSSIYDGPLLLIRPDGGMRPEEAHAWQTYASNIDEHIVAGTHYTLIQQPQVEAVATLLKATIEQMP